MHEGTRQRQGHDGLNTGGLTEEQAQIFVGTLRDQPGLITVHGLTLVEHRGKPYLQFSVVVTRACSEFTPVGTNDEGQQVDGLTSRTHYQFGTADFDVEITHPEPLSMDW